jgi:hypothetical protein
MGAAEHSQVTAQQSGHHFIAVHIQDMTGGKTYSQLSTQAQAQPNNTKLASLVDTVFKGETLRSMPLNAYGWWKVSQITYIASLISFGLGGLALIGSVLTLATGRRTKAAASGGWGVVPRGQQSGALKVVLSR